MPQALLIERSALGTGWVETWTLNAPATRNALTDEMVAALRAACERAQGDAALRVIVLRGAGGQFCAGGSLGGFASAIGRPHGEGVDPLIAINRDYGRLLQSLCALPQILIAAVQGAAMGGGVGLVCCADHVLAAPDAVFATPEVTLGLVPAQIAPFVVRRLGDARARDWLLSGARWSARQALVAGLVHAVVDGLAPSPLWGEGGGEGPEAPKLSRTHPHPNPLPPAGEGVQSVNVGALPQSDDTDFDTQLLQLLKRFTQAAPAATAETKQLLAAIAAARPLDETLDAGALAFARALRGPEAAQGLKAFAARQPAPWVEGAA